MMMAMAMPPASGVPVAAANGQAPAYMIQAPPPVVAGNSFPPFPPPPPCSMAASIPGGGQPPVHYEPASGIGLTESEMQALNEQIAYDNNVDEPQDFKPADDDPARLYWCRELDNAWTLRSRFTIDNLGDCRWYITDDGRFYSVRLPN